MVDQRLDPDRLLARAQEEARQEGRGKLKIYLGAAPGVGKTYEMLHDALEKRAKDLDVVVGIVESHGREDIDHLLADFEIIPRKVIEYHGTSCLEFDLDAALQRNPGLILVDEMAHTNAPDERHPKRWQDIKELLDRGIDVYTTLNVQHIESIKDDAAQIIKAPITETVPDSMIERADAIELVDLPPEELLKRLDEGKVYIPQQAVLAREHFFRKGNLIALRELALRTTAKRVGTDVLWYRQGEHIKHIWPSKEKILVCVGPRPDSLKLIRAAKRMANGLAAEWLAVYIDTPRIRGYSSDRNKAIQNLRLAEVLGAETHILTGLDIVKEVMNFAHEQNVTLIMVWKHLLTRWRDWFRRNLTDELVRSSGEIDVYIMTGERTEAPTGGIGTTTTPKPFPWRTYAIALGVVALATLTNTLLDPLIGASNQIMIYLVGVTFVALLGRIGPSVLASTLSVIAFDFFFIPPFYTFSLPHIKYFFILVAMLLTAQIIIHLTILTRRQAEYARKAQQQTTALYTFSRKLTTTRGVDKLLALGLPYMASAFNSEVMVLLPGKASLEVQSSYPPQFELTAKELSIAQWVYDMGQPAGFSTDTLSFSSALYLPLLGAISPVGVLRIKSLRSELYSPEQRGLLESCTNQLALALEVERLQEKSREKELEIETDRARTVLLTAIFHDLCFPLQRVIRALESLRTLGGEQSKTIEDNIDREINKLTRLNNNLYQTIELESQSLVLKKTLASIEKIIRSSVTTARRTLEKRPIQCTLPDNIPSMMLDKKLIQDVLIHLIDNAIKFSPPKSPIYLSVKWDLELVTLSVEDFGQGIIADEKNKLFKKFYKGKKIVTQHGLGLGLTICERIITAHQGTIWVENKANKGAVFRFTLPRTIP
ncbi:MAG: DUF4118 domain-containing protein [Legionellales bacterium]